MTKFAFEHWIERGEDDVCLTVEYTVSPFIEQTREQPAEGGEVEVHSVKDVDSNDFTLTDDEESALVEACADRAAEDIVDEAHGHADYLYDQYRDRIMERGL